MTNAGTSWFRDRSRDASRRDGATLVEVMVASVILLVMALGSTAFMYHSRANIGIQRNKRVAVDVANSRLEEVRASNYDEIKPLTLDYGTHYLSAPSGTTWTRGTSAPGETVTINGQTYPIVTTVRYIDVDSGTSFDDFTASHDAVRIAVSVSYRINSSDVVTLQSIYGP
ncbi:MAG: prepilin-type N-terminal cleavage/methylation domain-containing protein [Verrucomicrobia bacterium]|nr:prepilin-type N-terminal cleavage/methylation domain-containing protein [Verrucomicrobiota bacterium]MDA1086606.1 prepilin-type N-terminal cleavage/methylation domain-containing protein [Verrucomicrobiota bacterium]